MNPADRTRFCTNCGAVHESGTICVACGWDARVPRVVLERYLASATEADRSVPWASMLEYPGERASLLLATLTIAAAGALAAATTIGVAIPLAAIALSRARIAHADAKASLLLTSPSRFETLWRTVQIAAYRLRMPSVPAYVEASDAPVTYARGFKGNYWLVVSTRTAEILTEDELLFVVARELGRVRQGHAPLLTVVGPNGALGDGMTGRLLGSAFNQWLRRSEYSADRAGLVCVGDFRTAAAAIIKTEFDGAMLDADALIAEWGSERDNDARAYAEALRSRPYAANRLQSLRAFFELLSSRGVA